MDFDTIVNNVAGEWNASHLTTKIQKWVNEANREVNNFTNWEYMIEAGVALAVLTGAKTADLSGLTVPFDSPRLLSITESITPNGLGIYTSYKAFKDAIPVVDDVGIPSAVAIKGDTLYFDKELDQNITFTIDYLPNLLHNRNHPILNPSRTRSLGLSPLGRILYAIGTVRIFALCRTALMNKSASSEK
jgi:hypothetical protein